MASVFLCHSSSDKPFVRRLATDLVLQGIRVWLDEAELLVGDSLADRIADAIAQMDYLAVILTPYSVKSHWVRRELEIALHGQLSTNRVKVLPIVATPCEIPRYLHGLFYLRMTNVQQYAAGLHELLRRLVPDSSPATLDFSQIPGQERFGWIRHPQRRRALLNKQAQERAAAIATWPADSPLVVPVALELLADRSKLVATAALRKLEAIRDTIDEQFFEYENRQFGRAAFDRMGQVIIYTGDSNLLEFLGIYLADHKLPREVVATLPRCTTSGKRLTRAVALYCLGHAMPPFAVSHLIQAALNDDDELVREVAVWGLSEFAKNPLALPAIENVLLLSATDVSADIRRRALKGLRHCHSLSVIKSIIELSTDPNYEVCENARRVLVERSEPEAAHVVRALLLDHVEGPVERTNEDLRLRMLEAIRDGSGGSTYEEVIIDLLNLPRYFHAFDRTSYEAKQVAAVSLSALAKHGTLLCRGIVEHFASVRETVKVYDSPYGWSEYDVPANVQTALSRSAI